MRLPPSLALSLAGVVSAWAGETRPIEFNRDIRPILSENCLYCHGQDANHREAKLRLDDPESALRDRGGYAAISPANPEDSEIITRLLSTDDEERMPPAKSNKHVTPDQIALIRQWIAQGAHYEKHWAFTPPVRAPLPKVKAAKWARQPWDRFVLARLEQEKLAPSPEAAPATWLRRASFDLTGLPPSPAELDAFAADVRRRGERAYVSAVDRLLASPHFGERQAIDWLDAARYADSHGFNNDGIRTMWRWRDWVIEAFNANKPYDQFITEQLAGDLLPKPTLDQRIATGFSRNHVINSEGGIIDEEYRVEYVSDRVRTTSTAWLGLTMECAKCHDHKFDPIKQTDYYRLFSFFNNVPEHGEDGRRANAVPMIPAPTREQQALLAQQAGELDTLASKLFAATPARTFGQVELDRLNVLAQATTLPVGSVALFDEAISSPGLTRGAWTADAAVPAPKFAAAKLEWLATSGVSLTFWLNPAADNPRDTPLFSSLNHEGNPVDAAYGRGQEVRLIDGEIELRISERLPVYAMIIRTEGAAIRPGEWRHVVVTYNSSKRASGIRLFVDGVESATRVLYDDYFSLATTAQREFSVGADNAKDSPRWRGTLDDARSFARPLESAEVRRLFQ